MRIQVGIYQEKEQLTEYLAAKGIQLDDIIEVGPFPSRLQAMEWMDFLGKKWAGHKLERHAVGYMNRRPWYGFTFA